MAGCVPDDMRNALKFCANCLVYDWKQTCIDALKRCKECKVVWYCDDMCQKEHWHNTHKKQCKYLSNKKVLRNVKHEETTCLMCKEEASVGREGMSKESNPTLPCIMSRANMDLMNIDESFFAGLLYAAPAEMTGVFHTKQERLIVTFMRILVKMKMIKHSLWRGSRTAVLAGGLFKRLWNRRIDHLMRALSFKKPGPLEGQLALETIGSDEDSKGLIETVHAIDEIRLAAESRGIIAGEEYPSLFKPWETIKVLTQLLCAGANSILMYAADCVGVDGVPEEIGRVRTTLAQFNMMRENVLNLLRERLVPYTCLVVDGLCDRNPVKQCIVCKEEVTVRKVSTDHASPRIPVDPVIVLHQLMTYALCGRETCYYSLWEAEGSFCEGRMKLDEQYCALAGDHMKEVCDYCGHLNHKAKGLRCADCLTKLYCGVECQVKDTYHLQSKCERGDKRKKKRSDNSRKKEGLREMSARVSKFEELRYV